MSYSIRVPKVLYDGIYQDRVSENVTRCGSSADSLRCRDGNTSFWCPLMMSNDCMAYFVTVLCDCTLVFDPSFELWRDQRYHR